MLTARAGEKTLGFVALDITAEAAPVKAGARPRAGFLCISPPMDRPM